MRRGRPKKFSREELLDKTIQVFWKHGFAETTIQDLERSTGLNKSSLYAEFQNKEGLFIAGLSRYFELLHERNPLKKRPLGWNNVEEFLKACYGTWGCWGQKGCFSVNSMREFSDLPIVARELMIGSMTRVRRQLIRNLSAARKNSNDNEVLADLVISFFSGISVEQNLGPAEKKVADKIAKFMRLIRSM